jgi:AraC-like DNA-binding protein/sulfur transfer complex TusBCD TusB component (DsrH family)
MITFTLYQILLLVTIIFLVFFTLFLLFHKKGNVQSNNILGLMLFSYAMTMVNFFLFTDQSFFVSLPHLFLIGAPFAFLWGPTYYLYLQSLTDPDFRLRWDYLIHGFLFIACYFYLFPRFIFHGTYEKILLLQTGAALTLTEISIMNGIHAIQLGFYVIASFVIIRKYRREIKNNFSSIDKTNVLWIDFFFYSFSIKMVLDIIYITMTITIGTFPAESNLLWLVFIIIFILIVTIIYKALQSPGIFLVLPRQVKYEGSTLSENEKDRIVCQLTEYMEKENPHRQPNITIKELSERLKLSPRFLSQVLNERIGKNFFDFINSYRIKDFKKAISGEEKRNFLETLYEVGFNSKSSFNKAFKKHTSMTPRQYKKSRLNSAFPPS